MPNNQLPNNQYLAHLEDGDRHRIFIMGTIGQQITGSDVIQYMAYLPTNKFTFEIFSRGGYVHDALAIYDWVKAKGYDLETKIFGFAGSAATIIACASKKDGVSITENSTYFVHKAYRPSGVESPEQQESIDKLNNILQNIYQSRCNKPLSDIKKAMEKGDDGLILTADEAIEYGFVDRKMPIAEANTTLEFINKMENKDQSLLSKALNFLKANPDVDVKNMSAEELEAKAVEVKAPEMTDFKAEARSLFGKLEQGVNAQLKSISAKYGEYAVNVDNISNEFKGLVAKNAELATENAAISAKLEAVTKAVNELKAGAPITHTTVTAAADVHVNLGDPNEGGSTEIIDETANFEKLLSDNGC